MIGLRRGAARLVILWIALIAQACGERGQAPLEPRTPDNAPRLDHIPSPWCGYVPGYTRTENDSTETITITFEGKTDECWLVGHVQGVTFGVPGGALADNDSLWQGLEACGDISECFDGGAYDNPPSPVTIVRVARSWTGDIFFDSPVRSVGFYYCLEGLEHYVYAFNEAGSIVDWVHAPPHPDGSQYPCTEWTQLELQASSDVIAQVRFVGVSGNPVIDDLSFTRALPPTVQCDPDPVVRGEPVTCRTVVPVEAVNGWTFEGTSAAGSPLVVESSSSDTTWTGIAVQSGTVFASVVENGASRTLQGPLNVTDRTSAQWRWDSSKWSFQEGGRALCNYTPVTIPTSGVDLGQNTPIGRCSGGVVDPSPSFDPTGGYVDDMVPGGPNDGLWYVVEASYEMNRGSSMNPYLTSSSGQTHTLTFKKDVDACVDNDPGINKGDPVVVNWYRYNAVCRQESANVFGLHAAIWSHEGYGTNPAPPQPNGHQARYELAAGVDENDPYGAVENEVEASATALQFVIGDEVFRVGDEIHDFASDESFVKDNGFGSDGNCGSVWLFHTDRGRFLSTEIEIAGGCI